MMLTLTIVAVAVCAQATIPAPSWDTLPLYTLHAFGTDTTNETVLRSFASIDLLVIGGVDEVHIPGIHNSKCVKINKAQDKADYSSCPCCTEDWMIKFARRLKKLNKQKHVLAYANAVLAYPPYRAAQVMMQNETYWLRNSTGYLVHNIKANGGNNDKETWLTWDYSRGAGAIYAQECLSMVKSGVIDGIFADGCQRTPYPLAASTKVAYEKEKYAVLRSLQAQIPGYLVCASTGKLYEGQVSGATEIQNFGKFGNYSKREIPLMLQAKAAGVAFMAMPIRVHKGDPYDPRVQTELAAFLIGAGERSYYGTSSPHKSPWKRLPIHDMRIGKPLGDAVLRDGIYTRSFAAGVKVTYDTASETGTIQWADHRSEYYV